MMVGRVLGGEYELREELARGGQAVVYRAYSRSRDADVALKVLAPRLAQDPAFRARFLAEFRSLAQLHHENLVEVYGYGAEADLVYIAMRLVPGGTLKDRLNLLDGPLDLVTVARLLGQVANALQHAHDRGLVHLDLKPANILLGRADWPLLADFGITRAVGREQTERGNARLAGTPAYMAPEQCAGGPIDGRVDEYALAVTAYELLTGRRPFAAETTEDLLLLQQEAPPPRPRELNPGIPGPVEEVLLKGLAKDPAERYPRIAEFGEALGRAVEQTRGASLETKAALAALAPNLLGVLALVVLGPLLLLGLPPASLLGGHLPLAWPFQILLALGIVGPLLPIRWHLIGLIARGLGSLGASLPSPREPRPGLPPAIPGRPLVAGGSGDVVPARWASEVVGRSLAGTVEGAVNLAYLFLAYRLIGGPLLTMVRALAPPQVAGVASVAVTLVVVVAGLVILAGVGRLSGFLVAAMLGGIFLGALATSPLDLGFTAGAAPGGSLGVSVEGVAALLALFALLAARGPLRSLGARVAEATLAPLQLEARPTATGAEIAAARRQLGWRAGTVVDLLLLLAADALLRPPLVAALAPVLGTLPAAILATGLLVLVWIVLAARLRALAGAPGLILAVFLGAPLLISLPILDPRLLGTAWPATVVTWGLATMLSLLLVAMRGPLQQAGRRALGPRLDRGLLGTTSAPSEDALEQRVGAFGSIVGAMVDVALLVAGYWILGVPLVAALEHATGLGWIGSAALLGVVAAAAVIIWRRLAAAREVIAGTGGAGWARRAGALPGIALGLAALLVAGAAAAPVAFAAPDLAGLALDAPAPPELTVLWNYWRPFAPDASHATHVLALACSDGRAIGEFQEQLQPGAGRPMPAGASGTLGPTGASCDDWRGTYLSLRQAAGLAAPDSLSWSWVDVRVTLASDGSARVEETHRVLFTAGATNHLVWAEPGRVDDVVVREGDQAYPLNPTGSPPDHYTRAQTVGGQTQIAWWFPAVAAPAERTYTIQYTVPGVVQSAATGRRFSRAVLAPNRLGPAWRTTVEVVLPATFAPGSIHLASSDPATTSRMRDARTAWFDVADVPSGRGLTVSVDFGGGGAVPTSTPLPSPTPTAPTSAVAPTAAPSDTPAQADTPSPTDTPAPTDLAAAQTAATDTPQPSATPSPASTETRVPTATATRAPTRTATEVPTATATLAATATATATMAPTSTATPTVGPCAGDEQFSFSTSSPIAGQTFSVTATSGQNPSDVKLSESPSDNPSGPSIGSVNGLHAWTWQVTPATPGRRDFYFFVRGTLCTTNYVVVAPAPTPTRVPTFTPTATATKVPTATFTPTATPCPQLANPTIVATILSNGTQVSVTWRSTGGCAPYSGTINATYSPGSYGSPTPPVTHSYPISTGSGTITDTPPSANCWQTITYTLNLKDSSGQSVSASTNVSWCAAVG